MAGVATPRHLTPPVRGEAQPPSGWRLSLRRAVRIAMHVLAILAGWLLFFWGWWRVLSRGTDFDDVRALVIGAAIVVPVITVSWILHNRGIHRRKGPRRHVPDAVLDYRVDFNGRQVMADWPELREAQAVEVVLEGALKRYRLPPAGQSTRPQIEPTIGAESPTSRADPAAHAAQVIDAAKAAAATAPQADPHRAGAK
jgi:hypothetical protein